MIYETKWWWPLLIAMFLAQIAVPAYMIYQEEMVVMKGEAYKFKTAPVDPADPFRGRYLVLRFEANNFPLDTSLTWQRQQAIFVQLEKDSEGFAKVKNIGPEPPVTGDYVQAKVTRFGNSWNQKVHWEYDFNRFYMQEFQSLKAEKIYRNAIRDTSSITYAKVMVKDGNSTLTDVIVNDTSIVTLSRIPE